MRRRSSRLGDDAMIALAVLCGGGSLALFVAWPLDLVRLGMGDAAALLWDALLSIAFFLQHSVMVRAPVRERLGRFLPERYLDSVYAVASGVVLALVLLLWQTSPTVVFAVHGPFRWAARGIAVVALAGFVWGGVSLRFDPLGLGPIRAHLRGTPRRTPTFTVRGAYRWVRHPLYGSVLLLIWAEPDVTADRLVFDVLWTAWIVVGTLLEEKDLVRAFGGAYLEYRRRVPMLIPWRAPAAAPWRGSAGGTA